DVAQGLDVVVGADDGVQPLGAVVVVVVGAHAGVGVPIGFHPAVAIAVAAGQGDVRQIDAAGALAGPDGHHQQVASFDAADGVVVAGQAGRLMYTPKPSKPLTQGCFSGRRARALSR